MLSVKRNESWEITNYEEIMNTLQGAAVDIKEKLDYYVRRYFKKVNKSIVDYWGNHIEFNRATRRLDLWYHLVDTRKILLHDMEMTFYIWATTGTGVDVHVLIETENKKDFIILFMTGTVQESRGILNLNEKGVAFVPILIEDHFIKRYIERQPYKEDWKTSMVLDLAFLGDFVDQVRWEASDEFVPMSIDELKNTKESISSLYANKKFDEVRDRLFRSCLFAAFQYKFALIMLPPKKNSMYTVKTFLEPGQLFDRQKEIVEFQHLLWRDIKKRCSGFIRDRIIQIDRERLDKVKKEGAPF